MNELSLWICLINIVYFHVCFSTSMKSGLQTLPAQPVEIFVKDEKSQSWSSPAFLLFNIFISLANLVTWEGFLNLASQIKNWQCFHTKRNKCSHSLPPPLHSSTSIAVSGSECHGSFKLLFMTNLRVHFRWLMGTFPSLSIRTRAVLSQLWNLNFLHLKSCSGLGLGKRL